MNKRMKRVVSPTLPSRIEFEVTCYVNPPDGSRRISRCEDTYQTKQFRVEIEFCNAKERFSRTQTTSVCRQCKGVLLRELWQRQAHIFGQNEVEFLLKHELKGKLSNFRIIAVLGVAEKEWGPLREEDSCPLCKFAFSPFDRASSLSEQSLSRSGDLRGSPCCPPKHAAKKNFQFLTGDAPFATEVTPQGEIIQKKPRSESARPNYITGEDLQLKSSRERAHSLVKHPHCPLCHSQRQKATEHSRRRGASFPEEDGTHVQALKRVLSLSATKQPHSATQVDLFRLTTYHQQTQHSHTKPCRVM